MWLIGSLLSRITGCGIDDVFVNKSELPSEVSYLLGHEKW